MLGGVISNKICSTHRHTLTTHMLPIHINVYIFLPSSAYFMSCAKSVHMTSALTFPTFSSWGNLHRTQQVKHISSCVCVWYCVYLCSHWLIYDRTVGVPVLFYDGNYQGDEFGPEVQILYAWSWFFYSSNFFLFLILLIFLFFTLFYLFLFFWLLLSRTIAWWIKW